MPISYCPKYFLSKEKRKEKKKKERRKPIIGNELNQPQCSGHLFSQTINSPLLAGTVNSSTLRRFRAIFLIEIYRWNNVKIVRYSKAQLIKDSGIGEDTMVRFWIENGSSRLARITKWNESWFEKGKVIRENIVKRIASKAMFRNGILSLELKA